jgi:hypothetical protein
MSEESERSEDWCSLNSAIDGISISIVCSGERYWQTSRERERQRETEREIGRQFCTYMECGEMGPSRWGGLEIGLQGCRRMWDNGHVYVHGSEAHQQVCVLSKSSAFFEGELQNNKWISLSLSLYLCLVLEPFLHLSLTDDDIFLIISEFVTICVEIFLANRYLILGFLLFFIESLRSICTRKKEREKERRRESVRMAEIILLQFGSGR